MKKPGLPLSTLALVVVMLGALFMVSKIVTPPPAMPPPEPVTPIAVKVEGPKKEPTAAEKKQIMDEQNKMREMYNQKMKEQKEKEKHEAADHAKLMKQLAAQGKKNPNQPPHYDPSSSTIDSKFFGEMPMGSDGIEATDKAVAQVEAIKEKERRAGVVKNKPTIPLPPTKPVSSDSP